MLIVADRLHDEFVGVEHQPIVGGLLSANCSLRGGDRFNGGVAETHQIEILRGPEWIIEPCREKHCAFEDETITKGRQTQTVEKPFDRIASQDELEAGILVSGNVAQSRCDGRREIGRLILHPPRGFQGRGE